MKRYKCTVAYVGAAYDGWQSQKLGLSIQEQLEGAIERITHAAVHVIGSGRTDAGVNASGQVFMFDTELEMKPRKWMGAINAFLPDDIHILNVEEADLHLFHARYNVRWKRYVYRIHTGTYDVFSRNTACQCPVELDFPLMCRASRLLAGTHDFTAFNSSPLSEYPDQVRTIYDISLEQDGNFISITFRGKGFLRFMVRMMSEALIEVGKHKIPMERIEEMLASRSKSFPHRNAPACGLTLEEVNYFEILALNDVCMVREYLFGDELPQGWTLAQAEISVTDHAARQIFIMTERHSQKQLGWLECGEKNILHVTDPAGSSQAERLCPDLKAWLKKQGRSEEVKIAASVKKA